MRHTAQPSRFTTLMFFLLSTFASVNTSTMCGISPASINKEARAPFFTPNIGTKLPHVLLYDLTSTLACGKNHEHTLTLTVKQGEQRDGQFACSHIACITDSWGRLYAEHALYRIAQDVIIVTHPVYLFSASENTLPKTPDGTIEKALELVSGATEYKITATKAYVDLKNEQIFLTKGVTLALSLDSKS